MCRGVTGGGRQSPLLVLRLLRAGPPGLPEPQHLCGGARCDLSAAPAPSALSAGSGTGAQMAAAANLPAPPSPRPPPRPARPRAPPPRPRAPPVPAPLVPAPPLSRPCRPTRGRAKPERASRAQPLSEFPMCALPHASRLRCSSHAALAGRVPGRRVCDPSRGSTFSRLKAWSHRFNGGMAGFSRDPAVRAAELNSPAEGLQLLSRVPFEGLGPEVLRERKNPEWKPGPGVAPLCGAGNGKIQPYAAAHFTPGLNGHCVQDSPKSQPQGLHSLYLSFSSASKLTPAQSNHFCPLEAPGSSLLLEKAGLVSVLTLQLVGLSEPQSPPFYEAALVPNPTSRMK